MLTRLSQELGRLPNGKLIEILSLDQLADAVACSALATSHADQFLTFV